MRHPKPANILTETEQELMLVLWDLGTATVKDVQLGLADDRGRAYTSVATILKILDEKDFVSSVKSGRCLVYTPEITKPQYQAQLLSHLVNYLFDSNAVTLVERLIELEMILPSDLAKIDAD